MVQKSLQLPHHPALSRLEVVWENVIHLTFLAEFLLFVPDDPGSRWMFSDAVFTLVTSIGYPPGLSAQKPENGLHGVVRPRSVPQISCPIGA